MKKSISLVLVLVMVLSILSGCVQIGNEPAKPAVSGIGAIENCKTMNDVFALEGRENEQTALYSEYFIYAFELDGTYYRTIAEISEDIAEPLWALDWEDPDHDAKQAELIGPKELIRIENLSENIPAQEELDALVGKTGAELFEEGFTNSGWMFDDMSFWMNKGAYAYTFTMDGEIENREEFDEEDINELVVKAVTCDGIGDATNVELDENGKLVD